jgi:hypothetical protein
MADTADPMTRQRTRSMPTSAPPRVRPSWCAPASSLPPWRGRGARDDRQRLRLSPSSPLSRGCHPARHPPSLHSSLSTSDNGKVERLNRTLLEDWAYVRPYASNEMARRDVELGIVAMCIGGGQGIAMAVDRT